MQNYSDPGPSKVSSLKRPLQMFGGGPTLIRIQHWYIYIYMYTHIYLQIWCGSQFLMLKIPQLLDLHNFVPRLRIGGWVVVTLWAKRSRYNYTQGCHSEVYHVTKFLGFVWGLFRVSFRISFRVFRIFRTILIPILFYFQGLMCHVRFGCSGLGLGF